MMPTVYGCCSGQEAASTPAPNLRQVVWSSASLGTTSTWAAGDINYSSPIFNYDSASSAAVTDQQLNIVIDFNGGVGYSAGNTISQFTIAILGSETPRFTGNVTGTLTTIPLASLGTGLVIPTLNERGFGSFDILPYIIANGPDSSSVISWSNPQRLGQFSFKVTFNCEDDAGVSKLFSTTIAESPERPQCGPTVIPPTMTAVMATIQGGVTSTASGGVAFSEAIPMLFGGGQPISDYALTISFAFDDITYQPLKYDGTPNTLGLFILTVAPQGGGANFIWHPTVSPSPTIIEVGDITQFPLLSPPSATSYNVTQTLIAAGAIDPAIGLFDFPDPGLGNNFILSIQPTSVQDIYGNDATINPIVIPTSPLIVGI